MPGGAQREAEEHEEPAPSFPLGRFGERAIGLEGLGNQASVPLVDQESRQEQQDVQHQGVFHIPGAERSRCSTSARAKS